MTSQPYFASVTRIAKLGPWPQPTEIVSRSRWRTGDYVLAEVLETPIPSHGYELPDGRKVELIAGDWIVGALGVRAATLESTGSWEAVGDDLEMECMTHGGLLGKETSRSPLTESVARIRYAGHILVDGEPSNMMDWVEHRPPTAVSAPVILIIGTSMSAGKTVAARVAVRQLTRMGKRVVGTKLTGAAHWRDVLGMRDAGAEAIFDFVDVGLPSSIADEPTFRRSMGTLFSMISDVAPDAVVAEAGASPLEPYNGGLAMEMLDGWRAFTLLCASDPYAVRGIIEAFGTHPDLVSGPAANTRAGMALVERLCGVPSLNLLNPATHGILGGMLRESLARFVPPAAPAFRAPAFGKPEPQLP